MVIINSQPVLNAICDIYDSRFLGKYLRGRCTPSADRDRHTSVQDKNFLFFVDYVVFCSLIIVSSTCFCFFQVPKPLSCSFDSSRSTKNMIHNHFSRRSTNTFYKYMVLSQHRVLTLFGVLFRDHAKYQLCYFLIFLFLVMFFLSLILKQSRVGRTIPFPLFSQF